jgi:hypothetical protein
MPSRSPARPGSREREPPNAPRLKARLRRTSDRAAAKDTSPPTRTTRHRQATSQSQFRSPPRAQDKVAAARAAERVPSDARTTGHRPRPPRAHAPTLQDRPPPRAAGQTAATRRKTDRRHAPQDRPPPRAASVTAHPAAVGAPRRWAHGGAAFQRPGGPLADREPENAVPGWTSVSVWSIRTSVTAAAGVGDRGIDRAAVARARPVGNWRWSERVCGVHCGPPV